MTGPAAAAFFDLDRTLMEGSSAFQFGRAAYRAGLMSRRQLVADALANVRFRLRGSTDADTHALRDRISRSLAGHPGPRSRAPRGRRARRGPAAALPADAGGRLRAPGRRAAGVHRHRGGAGAGRDARPRARVRRRRSAPSSPSVADGVYTGEPEGLFIYRSEKAEAIRQLAEREGIDLAESYAYSDSESDLPMLEVVGHAGRRQPRPRAARDRPGAGLGGAALRPARPPAEGERWRSPAPRPPEAWPAWPWPGARGGCGAATARR